MKGIFNNDHSWYLYIYPIFLLILISKIYTQSSVNDKFYIKT